MATIKAGIIGAGGIARVAHIPAYEGHPDVNLTAVADIDEDTRQDAVESFSIPAQFESGTEMIESGQIDIVSVCTPPHTHQEFVEAAAENGVHVYCEKPLSNTVESARRMAEIAEREGIITQVGYALRFVGNFQRVGKLVHSDVLGDITNMTINFYGPPPASPWFYDREMSGGGAMMDKLPHLFDFLLYLFEEPLEVVDATIREGKFDSVEHGAAVSLEAGEVPIEISIGWNPSHSTKEISLIADHGAVTFGLQSLRGEVRDTDIRAKYGKNPTTKLSSLFANWIGTSKDNFHTARVHDFVDHVVDGDPETSAPLSRGVEIMELIDSVYNKEEVVA